MHPGFTTTIAATQPLMTRVIERPDSGARNWLMWGVGVCTDSSGLLLAACVGADIINPATGLPTGSLANGYIYTSIDGGITWSERTAAGSRCWSNLATNSSGSLLVATVGHYSGVSGYIYISTNWGADWTEIISTGNKNWRYLYVSPDGSRIVAIPSFSIPSYQYADVPYFVSLDGGNSWTQKSFINIYSEGFDVSFFNNGLGILLKNSATKDLYKIRLSLDGGDSWVDQSTNKITRKLICSPNGDLVIDRDGLYISTDLGKNFTAGNKRPAFNSSYMVPVAQLAYVPATKTLVLLSNRIINLTAPNALYISRDLGATWTAIEEAGTSQIAGSIACSASGRILFAQPNRNILTIT